MKLQRSVIAVVVVMIGAAAGTGCGSNRAPDEEPAGSASQPVAQAPSDGSNDPGARRGRRHKGGRHWAKDGRPRREWQKRDDNGASAPAAPQ